MRSDSSLGAFSKGQIVQVKDFDLPFFVINSSLLQLSSNKYTLFYDLFCLDYELVKLGVFSVRRIFVPANLVRSFKFDKNYYKYIKFYFLSHNIKEVLGKTVQEYFYYD